MTLNGPVMITIPTLRDKLEIGHPSRVADVPLYLPATHPCR